MTARCFFGWYDTKINRGSAHVCQEDEGHVSDHACDCGATFVVPVVSLPPHLACRLSVHICPLCDWTITHNSHDPDSTQRQISLHLTREHDMQIARSA